MTPAEDHCGDAPSGRMKIVCIASHTLPLDAVRRQSSLKRCTWPEVLKRRLRPGASALPPRQEATTLPSPPSVPWHFPRQRGWPRRPPRLPPPRGRAHPPPLAGLSRRGRRGAATTPYVGGLRRQPAGIQDLAIPPPYQSLTGPMGCVGVGLRTWRALSRAGARAAATAGAAAVGAAATRWARVVAAAAIAATGREGWSWRRQRQRRATGSGGGGRGGGRWQRLPGVAAGASS